MNLYSCARAEFTDKNKMQKEINVDFTRAYCENKFRQFSDSPIKKNPLLKNQDGILFKHEKNSRPKPQNIPFGIHYK